MTWSHTRSVTRATRAAGGGQPAARYGPGGPPTARSGSGAPPASPVAAPDHVSAVPALVATGEGDLPPAEPPRPDPTFERLARLVRAHLGVPVALVSFPEGDQETYLGAAGLVEPWASLRSTPLSWTFCQYVLADSAPLVVEDARAVAGLRDVPAIRRLDAVAYAGFPIHDVDGQVVASLCAVDHQPRRWTEDDLRYLEDTAQAASSEVQLRQRAQRAGELHDRASRAHRHSRRLLELAEAFARVSTTPETIATLRRFSASAVGASFAGVSLVEPDGERLVPWEDDDPQPDALGGALLAAPGTRQPFGPRPTPPALADGVTGVDAVVERATRYAAAVRTTGFYPSGADLLHAHGLDGGRPAPGASAFVPMLSEDRVLGVLVLSWDEPREEDEELHDTLRALGGYAALALSRSQLLEERRRTAHILQRSMLPELPVLDDVELDAQYATAGRSDEVGGDWYDVVRLRDGSLALMIGDVTGHDMFAAARMGQLRSVLRGLAWANDETPAGVLDLLDQAIDGIGLTATATAVLARLAPGPDGPAGSRVLSWSNAGHPAPLVARGDGTVELLTDKNDLMLGIAPGVQRHDRQTTLGPGDLLVLYTDGLVERRDEPLNRGIGRLTQAVADLQARGELTAGALIAALGPSTRTDDVAVLTVGLPR